MTDYFSSGSAYFVGDAGSDPAVNPAADPAWVAGRDAAGRMSPQEADVYYSSLREQALRNRVSPAAGRSTADALRDTPHHGQGARVHANDADHQRQMRREGLVGPRGGLTRKGSIAAERLRNQALDNAFGPL